MGLFLGGLVIKKIFTYDIWWGGAYFCSKGELGLVGNFMVYYKFYVSFVDHIQPESDFPDPQVFHHIFWVSVLGHIEIEQGAWSSCKFNQIRAQIKK